MSPVREKRQRKRPAGPPEAGWALGAGGLPKAVWAILAVLLLGLAAVLFGVGYIGYGAVIALLGGAAAVNVW